MADSLIGELATTISSASINHNPDPRYDANPSTTFSPHSPVRFRAHAPSHPHPARRASSSTSSSIPLSVLEPPPRQKNLPPLPDLRFEQSYLARIKPYSAPADGGPPRYLWVAWITFFDHFLFPFTQGVGWTLVLHGWRAWNSAASFQGAGVGARVRRWWWSTNNWKVPPAKKLSEGLGDVGEAEKVGEFFGAQFASAGMD